MVNTIKHLSKILILMVAAFSILLLLSGMIPREFIKENAISSAKTLEKEGLKHRIGGVFFFRLDNFTDALMINIALSIDEKEAIRSVTENNFYLRENLSSITQGIEDVGNSDFTHQKRIYARYWHGYLLFLRPLLTFTDYNGIRIINYVLLSMMLGGIIWMSIRQRKTYTLTAFILSLIFINFWMVPLSMQFSNTFYTAFAATLYILFSKINPYDRRNISTLFLLVGGFTSFTDLFTTPLVTLCIPLLFLINNNSRQDNVFKILMVCSLSWLIGYAGIWIMKWILAYILIGYDIDKAIHQVAVRTSTTYGDFDMSFMGIARFLFARTKLLITIAACLVIFLLLNIWMYIKNKIAFKRDYYLLLIALLPVVWFILIRNHSVIHCWFVWRLAVISVFAYSLFLLRITRSS